MKRIFSFVCRNRKSTNQRASRPRLGVELLEDRSVPAIIVVNTIDDEVVPGDNKTSLREAIQQADDTPGADTIVFAASGQGTITLDSALGQLNITDDLIINGPGISHLTVSGGGATRVFDITGSGTDVTIRGLTIADGLANGGAAVLADNGGGILNYGNLRLIGVVLSNNVAVGDIAVDDGGHGGGVANFGQIAVIGSTFSNNLAQGADKSAGPLASKGGAITFPGIGVGGGIFNGVGGTAVVTASHFISNIAQGGSTGTGTFVGLGQGGAIYNDANLTVIGSSFDGNQARGGSNSTESDLFAGAGVGGAISSGNHTILSGGTGSALLSVSFSSFTHNQAIGGSGNGATAKFSAASGSGDGFGGAIFVYQGNATIRFSTVNGNQALGNTGADGAGGLAAGGGILFIDFIGGVNGTVEGSAILENHAIGGLGTTGAGGNVLGGGIAAGDLGGSPASGHGSLTIRSTLFYRNFARGDDGADGGDGLGGAVYNDDQKSQAILTGLTMLSNQALGGTGGSGGTGGNGFGGGLFNAGTLTISRSFITRNTARGGTGGTAGQSLGGGIYSVGAPITLGPAMFVFGNTPDQIDD